MPPELMQLIRENWVVAAAAGAIVGLYYAGRLEESGVIPNPLDISVIDVDDIEAQIEFHEAKLRILREMKSNKLSLEDVIIELSETIQSMQSEINSLKEGKNNA